MTGGRLTGAADNLEGYTTTTGWKITKRINPSAISTGGFFSTCYIAEKDEKTAFLKALDFAKIFNSMGGDLLSLIKELTSAFEFERNVLLRCKDKRMSKVSLILDSGQDRVPGYDIQDVPYIIFELAATDIRNKLEDDIDLAFKLRSLHNICIGLNQLHSSEIAHQDLKPSNVLIYDNLESKVGDLGRSVCLDFDSPHDALTFSGDINYAPPEILYGYHHPEQKIRVYCTDMYLLGSLIVFYFTGYTMNAFLGHHLDTRFNPYNWRGTYSEVIPFLRNAFMESIETIGTYIEPRELRDEITKIIRELCNPVIEDRGPNRRTSGKYSVYKYINRLNILAKKAEYKLLKD